VTQGEDIQRGFERGSENKEGGFLHTWPLVVIDSLDDTQSIDRTVRVIEQGLITA